MKTSFITQRRGVMKRIIDNRTLFLMKNKVIQNYIKCMNDGKIKCRENEQY